MRFLAAIFLLLFVLPAHAQNMQRALVVPSCGAQTLAAGPLTNLTMNPAGQLCLAGIGGGTSPPTNSVAPVASGALTIGSLLSCTTGTWANSPTGYAYQWLRNAGNISSATSSTYTTVSADGGTAVGCQVTASNAGGSASALSNTLAIAANMSTPVMFNGGGPTATTTTYANIFGGSWNAIQASRSGATPIAGVISALTVQTQTAVVANEYTIALGVNGVASTLKCSVGVGGVNLGTTTTCSDATHTVSVNAGDQLTYISTIPGGTATTLVGNVGIAVLFTSTNGQESLIGGAYNNFISTGLITFISPSAAVSQTSDALASAVMPTAGTLDLLNVVLGVIPGSGKQFQFTVFKNGVATAVTTSCSLAVTCSDLADTASVVAGDTISIQACPGGVATCPGTTASASTAMAFSVRFKPTTANQAVVFNDVPSLTASASAQYLALSGASTIGATEIVQNQPPVLASTMTLGNLYVAQCPGPGAAITRAITLRSSGVSQTPTATIPVGTVACPTMTTANDTTHAYAATNSSLLNFLAQASSLPASAPALKIGMTVTVP